MNFEQNKVIPSRRWYQSIKWVVLLGVGLVVATVLVSFLILLAKYWVEIRAGRGEELLNQIYSGFSVAVENEQSVVVATRADIETTDDPFLGNPEADTVIVEFVDFKCSNCQIAHPILRQVLSAYGNKIKLIIRDFPAESIHPGANQLAQIVNCASEQGLYWIAHDWLFENQDNLVEILTSDEIKIVAGQIGMDYGKLMACMRSSVIATEINRDFTDGYKAGVVGTPTFFVNGYKIEGVIPKDAWDKFLSGR